jgi:hypothetical protein
VLERGRRATSAPPVSSFCYGSGGYFAVATSRRDGSGFYGDDFKDAGSVNGRPRRRRLERDETVDGAS